MDMGLLNAVVMVTGSSKSIGRAVALAFAREGARVIVTYYRDESGGAETARQIASIGGQAFVVALDLGDESSINNAVQQAQNEWGDVSVLVNNAVQWPGFRPPDEVFETAPLERFRTSLRANLEGPYVLTRAVIGGMRAAGWGRVVHVSTGVVEDGLPGSSAYATAKSGLHGLTRTMSRELARAGILTNVVMPGFTVSDDITRKRPAGMVEKVRNAAAMGRVSTPEDVSSLIVYLGSRANVHVTGELIRADGHFITPL